MLISQKSTADQPPESGIPPLADGQAIDQHIARLLAPLPRSRNAVIGSTGSGKSTIVGAILAQYRAMHKTHKIFIIDPKGRFFARDDDPDRPMFPQGYGAKVHGKREGTAVNARRITRIGPLSLRGGSGVYVVQSIKLALELFAYLMKHADVNKPVLIVFDETLDFCVNGLLARPVKRLIQMGRERGIAVLLISQRAVWMDNVVFSELDRAYTGELGSPDDVEKLARNLKFPHGARLTKAQRQSMLILDRPWFRVTDQRHIWTVRVRLTGI